MNPDTPLHQPLALPLPLPHPIPHPTRCTARPRPPARSAAGSIQRLGAVLARAAALSPAGWAAGSEKAAARSPSATPSDKGALLLHVPSPDWRDQVIYFVMTDRFADGDPRNNDQGAGEYDPRRPDRYSGGDLAGLRQRLDYIQGLGATALWITPPVANQWLNAQGSYSGYHGYWTEHFMKVDRHLGTLQDYRLLSDALHRRGMYLVQDIVVNHVGDFFYYQGQHDPARPERGWRPNTGSRPVERPTQAPFHLNDPRRAADRAAGVYHWTPNIADYQNREQELTWQMSGLDDLNTRNPRVREALRRSYAHWIREVGVDAFRVDTAFYVEPEFFEDFLWRPTGRGATPGMDAVARATGRRDFFVFGEGFGIDAPGQDAQGRRIESYMQGPQPGQRRMGGMLNFPLYGALGDVLARGAPTAVLGQRLRAQASLHPRLHWMPTFLDNHDVDRFLTGADERALGLGLAALFTLPGIPVIYYGTEQGFSRQRPAMFATGWGSDGRDRFDPSQPIYRLLRQLSDLRRELAPLRRAPVQVLAETQDDAGAIVWRMSHEGRHALVAFNTDDEPVTLEALPVAVPGQARTIEPAWGLDGLPNPLQVNPEGHAALTLPPRSAQVWHWQGPDAAAPTAPMLLSRHAGAAAEWQTLLDRADPAGDDHGPQGRYRYPTDRSYDGIRPADIRRVQVHTRQDSAGPALKVTLTLADISTVWSPRHGFDHVAFTLFLELPGQPGGSRVMPLQNGELPQDMRWHRRLRSHGWSLALFEPTGSGPESEGTAVVRGVKVATDAAARTVTFTLSAAALGRPASLSGARLWINTWDWDARYRALEPEPKAFSFGGGRADEPLVMDATDVLVLP